MRRPRATWGIRVLAARRSAMRMAAKTPTQIALGGGKHAGQLTEFLKQTPKQLRRTIKSFEKQIAKHEGWIRDPTSKVRDFHGLRAEQRQNMIHHWEQDIARHKELKSIAEDVLKGKWK